jgi:hypothetical protein
MRAKGARGAAAALALALVATAAGAAAADAPEKKRTVVFVSPQSEQLDAQLRDALTAQLAGGKAELVFEHFATAADTLRSQVSEARSLASAHDAMGVFWLDAAVDRDWLVYLCEPDGDRVLVRRITLESDGTAAATEAVAVITRQSSEALVEGQTIGMQAVDVPVETRAAPEKSSHPLTAQVPRPPTVERGRGFGISIAYVGDSPAREIVWQSGMHVAATYRARSGVYASAGFTLLKEMIVESPDLVFQVNRLPVELGLGVALGHGRLFPSLELAGIAEITGRHVVSAGPIYKATPDATRTAVFLSPRVRLGYTVSRMFEIYLRGGLDFAVNGFSFVTRVDGTTRELLKIHDFRPALEVGGSFWP